MENTFVWILIFAGATIALLGVFLVASERELKKKRLEIGELLAKSSDAAAQNEAPPVNLVNPVDQQEVSRLMTINEDLQNQINNQAAKLELARRTIDELETETRAGGNSQAEIEALRAAKTQMGAEIDELNERLQLSAGHHGESASQNEQFADSERRLRQEISELNEKLEESQHKVRELESSERSIANTEAIEAAHAQERQSLELRIAALGKELAAAQEKFQEYDSVCKRLAESERMQRDLVEQNRRHGEEVARWRSRSAEADESQRRLAELPPACNGLLARYETLAQQSKEFQDDLLAFASLVTEPIKGKIPDGASLDAVAKPENYSPPSDAGNVSPEIASSAGGTEPKSKRLFGILALVLVAATGFLTYSSWNAPTEKPSVTAANLDLRPSDKSPEQPAGSTAAPNTATGELETATSPRSNISPQGSEALAKQQATKARLNVSGSYEIIRRSRVYAAPTEFATLIGDIEPGVKVFVVNARDGWLEIHSKHGRPPGYIRQEVAAPIARQN